MDEFLTIKPDDSNKYIDSNGFPTEAELMMRLANYQASRRKDGEHFGHIKKHYTDLLEQLKNQQSEQDFVIEVGSGHKGVGLKWNKQLLDRMIELINSINNK